MSMCEKICLLDELIDPLGYRYVSETDIFTSTLNAWQRNFGYADIYDKLASFFNMIFDCYPVYFNYGGKTWMIEFWKGQYGITTGSEVGIYHTDKIISPAERKDTIFDAASDNELLPVKTVLYQNGIRIAGLSHIHWWHSMFSLGQFSKPKELTLEVTIYFPDLEMKDSFVDSLLYSGPGLENLKVYHDRVSLVFVSCPKQSFYRRLYRSYVLAKNRFFCRLYSFITRCFFTTYDKVLYLYYYLPFIYRRIFRLRRFGTAERFRKNSGKY